MRRSVMSAALIMECCFVGMYVLGDLRVQAPIFLCYFALAFCGYVWALRVVAHHATSASRTSVLGVILLGLLFRCTLLPLTPTLSDDVYRYLWDGRVQHAGINPYTYAPNDPAVAHLRDATFRHINHPDLPTIYPPAMEWSYRLAATLEPTITMQKLFAVVWDVLILLLLILALPRWGIAPLWGIIYAWNPLVIVEIAGSGHNDALGLFWLVVGCYLWTFAHPWARRGAMVAWGIGILSKIVPILLVPWWLAQRDRWRYLGWCIVPVICACLPFLAGLPSQGGSLRLVDAPWEFNASLYAVFTGIGLAPALARLGGALLVAALAWRWAQRGMALPQYLIATIGAALLVSPVVEPWYVVWLVPFLCISPQRPWLAFTGLVALSYVVLIMYVQHHIWQIPWWVPWIEYGVVYGLLYRAWSHARSVSLQHGPPVPPIAPVVSVIIPALNEEEAIARVLDDIPRDLVQEVIVVDNGSTDQTAIVAAAHGARVLPEMRRGYGQACLTGLAAVRAATNVIVFLDADYSDHPEEIPALIDPIVTGAADLVIGSRVLGGAPRGSLTVPQRCGNWLACQLMLWRWGVRYTDLGPFRAIRRTTIDGLGMQDRAFGWTVEMQIKAILQGVRITERPAQYRPRIGQSKISGTIRGTILAGTTILRIIARYAVRSTRAAAYVD